MEPRSGPEARYVDEPAAAVSEAKPPDGVRMPPVTSPGPSPELQPAAAPAPSNAQAAPPPVTTSTRFNLSLTEILALIGSLLAAAVALVGGILAAAGWVNSGLNSLRADMATKADLAALKMDNTAQVAELKTKIEGVGTKVDGLKDDNLKASFALQRSIDELKAAKRP
jgi:hypothetical protein